MKLTKTSSKASHALAIKMLRGAYKHWYYKGVIYEIPEA
jgi:hypothetical protein